MSIKADHYFTIIPEWVLYANISANAVRLYGVLRRYADDHGTCWPSRKTVAEKCHADVKTVTRAIAELVEIGAVTVEARVDGENRQTTNLYVIHSVPTEGKNSLGEGDKNGGGEGDKNGARTIAIMNESQNTTQEEKLPGATAQSVTAHYVDTYTAAHGETPPKQLINRVAQAAKQLLTEGRDETRILAAAEDCARTGHANLPSTYSVLLGGPQKSSQTALQGSVAARTAWDAVVGEIRRVGSRQAPEGLDETAMNAVRRVGWRNICSSTEDQAWRMFSAAYQALTAAS